MTVDELARALNVELILPSQDPAIGTIANFADNWFARKIAEGRRDGAPMNLKVYGVLSPGFNAFAARCDEADVIFFHHMVPYMVRSVARAVASYPYILPDDSVQRGDYMEHSFSGNPRDFLNGAVHWQLGDLSSKSRNDLANQFTELALFFVFSHELAHIYNGHLEYIAGRSALKLLVELEAATGASPRGMERETIEYDADCYAVGELLVYALRPEIDVVEGRAAWALPQTNYFGSQGEAIQKVMIAFGMVTLLMALGDETDFRDEVARSHPHPIFRQMSSGAMVLDALVYRTGRPYDDFAPLLSDIVPRTLYTWNKIFPDCFVARPWDGDALPQAHARRLRIWNDTWAAIYPELNKHKRGGQLAPPVGAPHPKFPHAPGRG